MSDLKITQLTSDTTPTGDDLLVSVDDVAGTPTNKKVLISDLLKGTEQSWNITTVNAATYDLASGDMILNVTYTGTGAVTSLTLMTAETTAGRIIIIKDAGGNAGTNNITVDTEGAETIDGAATAVINGNYNSLMLYSDGSDWFIF